MTSPGRAASTFSREVSQPRSEANWLRVTEPVRRDPVGSQRAITHLQHPMCFLLQSSAQGKQPLLQGYLSIEAIWCQISKQPVGRWVALRCAEGLWCSYHVAVLICT